MAQIFVPGQARMSFDGVGLFAQDTPGGVVNTVAFADQRIVFVQDNANSYPSLIDGSSFPVNRVPGLVMGQIQISGVVQPDRAFHTFLNAAFGPRTTTNGPALGQLFPWLMNLVPYAGGAAVKASGIWWQSIRLYSAFSTQGGQQMVFFTLSGMVLDPNNAYSASTLSAPAYVGTAGAGIAPFARATFTDDSSGNYDLVRSFDLALSNGLRVIPAIKSATNRVAAGCVPSSIAGALTLTQLKGATAPVPQAQGTYPLDIVLPTGDATHTLTVAGSWSYDSLSNSYSPTDFVNQAAAYTLFSTSAGATATAGFPFVASYS